MTSPGRLLGIDHGKVRVGLAVCDSDRSIVSPLETYTRCNQEVDARYFQDLIRKEEIAGLVVGLPIHNDGREGEQAIRARAYGKWLADLTGLPVAYWDERFTTQDAESILLSAGMTSKKRKARRDRLAAQIMLQAYIEAGCPD